MASSSNIRAGRAFIEVTADSSKLSRDLKNIQFQLNAFGESAKRAGKEMLTLATIAAMPMGLATKSFAAFDDSMRLVGATTKAVGEDFDLLKKKAQQLGRETSYTAQQAADAMVSLGRMGFNAQEIDTSIDSVLDLARATGTDLAEAADFAANSMRIFGLDSSKMTKVADVLTATANGSAQTLTDLFEALKIAGPQAMAAGENIESTSAALGVLANMGIKGSLAGTALRKSFSQFASADVQSTLAEWSISTTDASGNLRSLADVMVDVAKAMETMPSAEKISFAEKIFDLRGSLAGLAITKDTKALTDFVASLKNVGGTAAETAKAMDKGIGGSFRLFQSAVEGSMNAIGESISTNFRDLLDSTTSAINSFTKWIEKNGELVAVIVKATVVVGSLGAALFVLGTASKVVAVGFGVAHKAVRTFEVACKAAKTANLALAKASTSASLAVRTLGKAGQAFMAVGSSLLVVVAAASALFFAFDKLYSYTAKVKEEMKNLREEGDKQRKLDKARMERLTQLADKYHLSNVEMAEAEQLSSKLRDRYGNLGLSLDKIKNTLTLAADAQDKFNEKMKEAHLSQLTAELHEARSNMYEIYRERASVMGRWNAFKNTITFQSNEDVENEIAAVLEKMWAAEERVASLAKQIDAVRKGEFFDTQSDEEELADLESKLTESAHRLSMTQEELAQAEKRTSEIAKKIRQESQTALENEIEGIHELRDEYLKLLDSMLAYEKGKRQVNTQKVEALQAQIKKGEEDFAKMEAKARAKALKEETAALEEATNAYWDAVNAGEKDKLSRQYDTTLDELKAADAQAAVSFLEGLLQQLEKMEVDAHWKYIEKKK